MAILLEGQAAQRGRGILVNIHENEYKNSINMYKYNYFLQKC